jgi:hypothetical protein
MLYFSSIFLSSTPIDSGQENEEAVVNSARHSKKSLSCKFIQVDTQQQPITSRKRKQAEEESNDNLKKRGQNTLSQKKTELMLRLNKLKQRNAKLSKTYF